MNDRYRFILIVLTFVCAYFIPFGHPHVQGAIIEAFKMLQEYSREHVLFCLVPAFFIAGAIANFVSQGSILKYFGVGAKKLTAYSVASVSGTILSVCSCTVLPLFGGIYRRGAGLGPAVAFLYSGPAINILAIVLTARILGWKLGLARAVGAIVFSLAIGLIMAALFKKEEEERSRSLSTPYKGVGQEERGTLPNLCYFAVLVLILVFAAWGKPSAPGGFSDFIFHIKWYLTGVLLLVLAFILKKWFQKEELLMWVDSTWDFAKLIFPLLFAGVLAAGFLMGRPGTGAGLIPAEYIASLVGGNSLSSNLIASVVGALMYFATLTEIPIIQGLVGAGMGKGPALALLLAGPALSLPNMLVIRGIMGTKKAAVFVILVVIMATLAGMAYGAIA